MFSSRRFIWASRFFFLFYCYSYYCLFGFYYFLALFFICARSSIPDDNVTKKYTFEMPASIDNLSEVSNSSSRTGKILKSNSVRLRNKRSFPSPYWQGCHVGSPYNRFFSRRIYMKIEFSSLRMEMLLFSSPIWPPWRHVQTRNSLSVPSSWSRMKTLFFTQRRFRKNRTL